MIKNTASKNTVPIITKCTFSINTTSSSCTNWRVLFRTTSTRHTMSFDEAKEACELTVDVEAKKLVGEAHWQSITQHMRRELFHYNWRLFLKHRFEENTRRAGHPEPVAVICKVFPIVAYQKPLSRKDGREVLSIADANVRFYICNEKKFIDPPRYCKTYYIDDRAVESGEFKELCDRYPHLMDGSSNVELVRLTLEDYT